ncbi:MAG: thiamine diphosphokinase [Culicoidibacterales bacterium]
MKVALVAYSNWFPNLSTYDCVVAVDSGIHQFIKANVVADYWIGDCDSSNEHLLIIDYAKQMIQLPTEKDETDTHAAVIFAIKQLHANEITIFTTHSGRFDHQYVLLLLCELGLQYDISIQVISQTSKIQLMEPGEYVIPKSTYQYISLFAWHQKVEQLSITGVKYPLDDVVLLPANPLGISNEICETSAKLSFGSGKLLVIESSD